MWSEIKQILAKTKGTCIIVEDGKPAFVVTAFDDFRQETDGGDKKIFNKNCSEQELLEKINQDITDWKARQAAENPELDLPEGESGDELKIEDLPLI